jgi:hypothetical protein
MSHGSIVFESCHSRKSMAETRQRYGSCGMVRLGSSCHSVLMSGNQLEPDQCNSLKPRPGLRHSAGLRHTCLSPAPGGVDTIISSIVDVV